MIDVHALTDTTGSTTLASLIAAANIPSSDGQTAPGVPIAPGAVLKAWGVFTTIADTLKECKLISQDQIDSINGEDWNVGAAGVLGLAHFDAYLPYRSGNRNISYSQNTGAAPVIGYTIDQYPSPTGANVKNFGQRILLPQVFGGALTANKWGTIPVAPTSNIPAGTYGILGAYVHALTNYALIRMEHADFGGKKPGFPVVDTSKAAARAVLPMPSPVFNMYGLQFMALGDIPVFRATSTGTGLTLGALSITGDTPNVILNLVQLTGA
jgi:hypothetical protein